MKHDKTVTRNLIHLLLLGIAASFLLSANAWAQDRSYTIRFPSGQSGSTVNGAIVGRDMVNYKLSARAGQVMSLSLTANNPQTYFNVYSPGRGPGDQALAVSGQIGKLVPDLNRFRATLPSSGEYTISVYMMRAAARRGERSSYALNVSIMNGAATQLPGNTSTVQRPGSGDPQFFQVTGVGSGDRLNVRSGPSTSNPVVFRLRNGDVVRNRGCRTQSGTRWCQVNLIGNPGRVGWASARYLTGARNPGNAQQLPGGGAQQLPGDALVPGTGYSATGTILCSIEERGRLVDCRFGVTRRGRGNATLVVTMPDGRNRRIEFEGGRPVSSNSQAGIYGEKKSGTVIVMIGSNESYHVFDEVLFGG